MSTSKQDNAFAGLMQENSEVRISSSAIEAAIEWIKVTFQPEDVFSEDALMLWAQSYDPDGIFKEEELEYWAEQNGFVKQ